MLEEMLEEKQKLEKSIEEWNKSLQKSLSLADESKRQLLIHQGHLERLNLVIDRIQKEDKTKQKT